MSCRFLCLFLAYALMKRAADELWEFPAKQTLLFALGVSCFIIQVNIIYIPYVPNNTNQGCDP